MTNWTKILAFVSAFVLSVQMTDSACAQGKTGITISDVRIEGAQRIEADTVRSYITLKPGQVVTQALLNKSLKKLFSTGLFADVILRREGNTVVVRVVENPVINRIAFEGNKRIDDETLDGEVKLRPRVVYTRSRVQNDVQRIMNVYRSTGRFAATVEPKVIQLPQNRVDLAFEIDEGPLTEIANINFIGNQRFSDDKLRDVVLTKESRWYRFLTANDSYDPDRITFDRELLRRHYLANGYADFRVLSAVAELAPDRERFFLTFTIEEGERYKFGKLNIITALKDLRTENLYGVITIKKNGWYNANSVEKSIIKLIDAVGNFGYAFVDVRPQINPDRGKRLIDVTFNIQEGPRVYVERIDIIGNVRTLDAVIRREFTLVEGDAFNASKMRVSRRRLRNLGFFEKVEVSNVPGSSADKTVIKVSVREQSTGEISFGAGFSSTSGVLGDIAIRERNLLGKGQDLLVKFQLAQRSSELELRYTEPHFLDRRLSGGVDIFRTSRDFQDESSFDKFTTGFALRLGYSFSENLKQSLRYTLSKDEVKDVKSTASYVIKAQEGTTVRSSVGQSLTWDKRNSRLNPSNGFLLRLNTELAGFGGTVHFLKNKANGTQFYPLTKNLVGSLGMGVGFNFGLGEDVRLVDRFFLGGNNLRGFKNSGVGPRDKLTDDSLGGNWYYSAKTELIFPLGLPNEFAIKGRVFNDFGSIGEVDNATTNVKDSGSLRASAGIGIYWKTAFGPISVDIASAYLKENFDETQLIRFNFGTRF